MTKIKFTFNIVLENSIRGSGRLSYGEFSKIYDELINEDINYTKICNRIIEICKEEELDFNTYLDLACGTGNVTVHLAKNLRSLLLLTYQKIC